MSTKQHAGESASSASTSDSVEQLGREVARVLSALEHAARARTSQDDDPPASSYRTRRTRPAHMLERLRDAFKLSAFEVDVFLATLAPQLEPRAAGLYAQLHGDPNRRCPTPELLLELLAPPLQRAEALPLLHPRGALFEWELLHVEGGADARSTSWYLRPLFVDLHVMSIMLGSYRLNERVAQDVRAVPAYEPSAATKRSVGRVVERLVAVAPGHGTFVQLRSASPEHALMAGTWIASKLRLQLLAVSAQRLIALAGQSEDLLRDRVRALARDALLLRGCIFVTEASLLAEQRASPERARSVVIETLAELVPLALLDGSDDALHAAFRRTLVDRPFAWISSELPAATLESRRSAWERALAAAPVELDREHVKADELASRHELVERQIGEALAVAADRALARNGDEPEISSDDVRAGVRLQSRRILTDLAAPIEARHSWDDLVLPEASLTQLRDVVAHRSWRHVVLDRWGFGERLSRGLGIHALFVGPPGTGKTLAASIIAASLELELYRIDLSSVVSKYIGETEKNLSKIFAEASAGDVVLFFDEADALFSKRTQVQDAHDRYANIETSFLLQRIEEHAGITILATNFSENVDEAFARRMAFVVDFPFPDAANRQRILEKLLPGAAPRAKDVDLVYLARHLRLAGGNLRNVVLHAAFSAAADKTSIGMRQLLHAAEREYGKVGRPFLACDFPGYEDLIAAE